MSREMTSRMAYVQENQVPRAEDSVQPSTHLGKHRCVKLERGQEFSPNDCKCRLPQMMPTARSQGLRSWWPQQMHLGPGAISSQLTAPP